MPRATFYILADTTLKARDLYACRVIEKAFLSGHKFYVHTANETDTQNFDTQLWTFRDISFVPHEIYQQDSNSDVPVLIGHNITPPEPKDILVNLTTETPPFYQQFQHIIEVIPNDADLKKAARKQYQAYQKQGYEIETFNIKATT